MYHRVSSLHQLPPRVVTYYWCLFSAEASVLAHMWQLMTTFSIMWRWSARSMSLRYLLQPQWYTQQILLLFASVCCFLHVSNQEIVSILCRITFCVCYMTQKGSVCTFSLTSASPVKSLSLSFSFLFRLLQQRVKPMQLRPPQSPLSHVLGAPVELWWTSQLLSDPPLQPAFVPAVTDTKSV